MNKFLSRIEKQAGLLGEAGRVASMVAGKAKTFGTAMKADSGHVMDQVKALKTGRTVLNGGRFKTNIGITPGAAAKELAGNKAVQGAGIALGTAAVGGAAIGAAMKSPTRSQEKQACLDKLLAQGLNFEDAVALVKQAEQDVYGK